MSANSRLTYLAARGFLAMVLLLTTVNLPAQETRKLISNPTPAYPDTAKRFRLTGVVKVQVVIAPDGQIKSTKVIGGHPLLVNAVEETLKSWKYAPAAAETTASLEASRKRVYEALTETKQYDKVIQLSAAMKSGMPEISSSAPAQTPLEPKAAPPNAITTLEINCRRVGKFIIAIKLVLSLIPVLHLSSRDSIA